MDKRISFIDGIRAISILSVVGFHASVPGFGGGYLGVDVFMVLSGYLIIGQIARAKPFKFGSFYASRAIRILPPMTLVVAITLLASKAIGLSPLETIRYSASALATLALFPNIYFAHHSGYFDAPSEREPFLHMWSLGVEEQFYLVVPALIVFALRALPRYRNSVPLILLALVPVSLWLFFHQKPVMAFYSMPARFWEFALGGLVAITLQKYPAPKFSAAIATAGIASIAASVLLVSPKTPFPGIVAFAPVLGCVLLLSSRGSYVHNCLSYRPLTYLGRISYSWYLWHWPIFVLIRTFNFGVQNFWLELFCQTLLAGALAALTYHFVEQPLWRLRHTSPSGVAIRRAALTSVTAVALVACGAFVFGRNVSAELAGPKFDAFRVAKAKSPFHCSDGAKCAVGAGNPVVVIWGDSLAGSLARAAGDLNKGKTIVISKSSCPPILNIDILRRGGQPNDGCSSHNRETLNYLRANSANIARVILIANWAEYGLPDSQTKAYQSGKSEKYNEMVAREFTATATALGSIPSTLIGPLPRWRFPAPECLVQEASRTLADDVCGLSLTDFGTQQAGIQDVLYRIASHQPNMVYVDASTVFCGPARCSPLKAGNILYSDTTHLTDIGAGLLAALINKTSD